MPTASNSAGAGNRQIAALFVSGRSIYRHMPNVLAWGRKENARQFAGLEPVIAHPPCRTWSKYLRHQAKPANATAEQELGIWAVSLVQKNGGVLEQPAESYLWEKCQLPRLNDREDPFCYTIQIEQRWFGYATQKKTWLLVCGVPPQSLPPTPFAFDAKSPGQPTLSSAGRSRTVEPFATWLCQIARAVWWREGER